MLEHHADAKIARMLWVANHHWRTLPLKLPESGCSRPYIIFTKVDFPAPFSPSNAWISPRLMLNDTSSFAVKSPKCLKIRSL